MPRAGIASVARSKSSRRWLDEHARDPHVRAARAAGYRSRGFAKLAEIDRRDQLLRPGLCVVDLGAAPGAWSQYALERVGERGRVIACDVLPMEPLAGVTFIEGDFRDDEVLDRVRGAVAGAADLVLSDMAPNFSGMAVVDQPASMALTELAHELAIEILKPGGALLTKMFQGEGSDAFVARLRGDFSGVRVRKPEASRPRSREVYVLATGRQL